MAINVSFNGATIFKPGAYSKTTIDLGGGFPLSPTGIVAIFGEADAGAPGSAETNIANNVFSPDQLPQIRSKYGRGPIVDACSMLFAPGADGAIPGGAQAVYIYKTNASVRALLSPVIAGGSTNDYGRLRALEWGTGGNKITYRNTLTAEVAASVTSGVITFPLTVSVGTNDSLKYRVNGGAEVTATIAAASYANVAALVSALNTALGATVVASAGTAANTIKLTQGAGSAIHRNGWGRSLQITSGNANTSLALTAESFATAASEPLATLRVTDTVSTLEETETVGGEIVLSIGRDNTGSCTAASVAVSATQIVLTQTGASPASITISKEDFPTVQAVADYIEALDGWTASVSNVQLGQLPISVLDRVSNVGAFYTGATVRRPARIKRDADRVANFFSLSSQVELIPLVGSSEVKKVGLPDQQGVPKAVYLSGGLKGGTDSAEITNALSKFEKFRVNSVVPLFSRDATEDLADQLTDGSSTYTIDAIHQAVKTHLSLMATTKKKSERQGYLSFKGSYEDSKTKAATMASGRIQMVIQDVRQIDSEGAIKWFQPWAGAALLAGARGGSPIGNPMTFKYFNMSGIRQTGQAMSVAEQDIQTDFDPDTMFDNAIQSGITFWEAPQTGGFRLVVDNTTYGKDGNWVYNRGHVLYAADVLAYDFRNQLENIYIGLKNTVSAAEIKSTCEAILSTYLAQGITVSTADAKNGFKQLVVQINGNTVNISVVVKLVEGIDFILADITLQRASQTA
jgi:hypothetical protein